MMIGIGYKGNEVEILQRYLGIPVDGIFGRGTEKAVIEFQKHNGLHPDGIVGPKTWDRIVSISNVFHPGQIQHVIESKGYVWFNDPRNIGYDLNIVGIRNSTPGDVVTNLFDDFITVTYKKNGEWKYFEWPATTDPGRKGVLEYGNPNGVARLVPGQYRGAYGIGYHRGRYEALRQYGPVKVYRDNNRDLFFDTRKIQEGYFGINIHKAGKDSRVVENWSEGCQVFKRAQDFEDFMVICRRAAATYGNSFTYTLIETKDIL